MERTRMMKVISPVENKDGKTFWLRVGNAFLNKDGSTNVYLNAYPANGKLQIRELDEEDLRPRARREAGGLPGIGGAGGAGGAGGFGGGLAAARPADDLPF